VQSWLFWFGSSGPLFLRRFNKEKHARQARQNAGLRTGDSEVYEETAAVHTVGVVDM
jgi:hypothetical protein